jgi:hypothetical protein
MITRRIKDNLMVGRAADMQAQGKTGNYKRHRRRVAQYQQHLLHAQHDRSSPIKLHCSKQGHFTDHTILYRYPPFTTDAAKTDPRSSIHIWPVAVSTTKCEHGSATTDIKQRTALSSQHSGISFTKSADYIQPAAAICKSCSKSIQ